MAIDLKLVFQLSAPPQRVLELLTNAALVRKWSGSDAVIEAKEGGVFEMFDGWVSGKVTKIGAKELAYTWKTSDWPAETKESEVLYILEGRDGGTKVTVHHTGLPTEDEAASHRSGWTDYFFDPLEDYIMIFEQ
ncbi:MAG: SRPBCC domain-containing protein [Taibaiella sp.]|nr:SRPBCC domain-containing protein [Taibaiella sp.]